MASLRDTVRDYLGLGSSSPSAQLSEDYSLARDVEGRGAARMSQLYYAPPVPQPPPPPQYQPPDYAPVASANAAAYAPPPPAPLPFDGMTYPPPPEIVPAERRGSVPPSPLPQAGGIPSLPLSQCAAPSPQQTPGLQRPAYADRHVPHGRGRGKGRERNRANSQAPTLGRGLGAGPLMPEYNAPPLAAAAAGGSGGGESEVYSDSSSGGEGGSGQQRHHHHHHRHYHRQYAQQQQQQQQPMPAVPQMQQQYPQPVVVVTPQAQPQPQQQVALYVHSKDVAKRRREVQPPPEHKPYFVVSITIVEIALYVYELIATSRVSTITFGSNPWQWGGVNSNVIVDIGGKYAPYILSRNEWWRFFTPIFLHVSLTHIVMNLLMQLKIGISLEKSYGFFRMCILYIICGIAGNVISSIFLYDQIQAGASGALFGFIGILLVDLIQNWKIVMNPVRNLIVLIVVIVISIGFGMMPGVDNFAHLGGFVFGIVGGFVFLPSLAPAKKGGVKCSRVLTVSVFLPILVGMLVALFVVFYTIVGAGYYSTEWCPWCSQINCAEAILGEDWCRSA